MWAPLFISCLATLSKASRPYNTPAAILYEKITPYEWPSEHPPLKSGSLSLYNNNIQPVIIHYLTHSIMEDDKPLFQETLKSLSFRARQLSQDIPISYQFENPNFKDKWDLHYTFNGKNYTFENKDIYCSFNEESKGILMITLLNFRRTCRFKMAAGVEVPFSVIEL